MFHLERAATDRRVGWPSLLGLLLVPLLFAGGFLWATWNSDDRLGRVQAAVVNLDQAVTIKGQIVPLGRQLAGGLVSGTGSVSGSKDRNFSWVLSDSSDAAAGLASGRYAAVVTIPKSFSARATSFSKTDPKHVEAATMEVQTSQISGVADPVIGSEIAAAAARGLSTQLTEQYLQNVYLGFNATKKQLGTVADAATKLSKGTGSLSTGLDKASNGTTKLAAGLGQLDAGASKLQTGASQLSRGVGQLSGGLRTLADGTAALPSQTRKLADGTAAAADGAAKLATGAEKLSRAMPAFTTGTKKNADGTAAYARGSADFSAGMARYAGGTQSFASGVRTYKKALVSLGELGPEQLSTVVPCPKDIPPDSCPIFLAGLKAGVGVGTGAALQGLADQTTPSGPTPGLSSGADSLSAGAAKLSKGADALSTGATQISRGAARLDTGARQISIGVNRLSGGVQTLSGGLGKLADGTDQLATGSKGLAKGTSTLAIGAARLSTGASALAGGVAQLADGTGQSADGADKLDAGLLKLSDGGDRLAKGSAQLADGLKKGQDKVPTFDSSTREKLSSVVSAPITAPPNARFADVASTTFLAVMALWIAALATYLVLRAVSSRVLASMKPSWRLTTGSLLPGVVTVSVQAVALTALLGVLLNLDAPQLARMLPFTVLAGLAFVATNHALVAWFGGVGRFISVALLVMSAAGAITSAAPGFFDAVRPFLPLSPALDGLRAIASDGPGAGAATGLLLAWLIVGTGAGILAVARQRVVRPLVVGALAVP